MQEEFDGFDVSIFPERVKEAVVWATILRIQECDLVDVSN
jgi:hypothetical protein